MIIFTKCPENQWINNKFNFDNIFNALLSLFLLSTVDGWSKLMNIGVNSNVSQFVIA